MSSIISSSSSPRRHPLHFVSENIHEAAGEEASLATKQKDGRSPHLRVWYLTVGRFILVYVVNSFSSCSGYLVWDPLPKNKSEKYNATFAEAENIRSIIKPGETPLFV